MPLTSFQSAVLNLLAASRSPDSYIVGGIGVWPSSSEISSAMLERYNDSKES